MKKQIAIASAILAATSYSFAEIALTESLSVEGFVDMSYTDSDNKNSQIGIDQVEFDFLFNAGAVSAQVDVQYEGDDVIDGANDSNTIEQAFVTYDLGNGAALTAGRFASQLGFEAFEPTGLYQNSLAYANTALPGYDQGVKYTNGSFGIAIVDDAGDSRIGDGSDYSIEVAYSTDLGNGLGAFLGGRYNSVDGDDDEFVIDAYLTYETGAWLFAAEVVHADDGNDVETSALAMANYSYSDAASVTARYSVEDGTDTSKITLAHNYALADNLALIAEVSSVDVDGADEDVQSAVELLFTF